MFENSKNKEFLKNIQIHSLFKQMDTETQLKYLEGLIRLGYSPKQAMDSWNKSVRPKRERDNKRGPERDKIETSEILISGRISPEEFINYQKNKLNKEYWDDLIKGLHLESLFDHFHKDSSTPATATNALMNIIEEKKCTNHNRYYPVGHINAGNRTLRHQWKAFTDAGWDFLSFNPLALPNHNDDIKGKTGFYVVSLYLGFVINEVLLQKFDKEFKSSASVKDFIKGLF